MRHLSRLVQMDILFLDVTDSGKNAKNPFFGVLLDLAHAVTQWKAEDSRTGNERTRALDGREILE